MKLALSILIISLSYIISGCNGFMCEEENFLGLTRYKECPGPSDPPEYQFCCGTKERRTCCQSILNLDEDDIKEIAKSFHINGSEKQLTEAPVHVKTTVNQEGFISNTFKPIKTKVSNYLNNVTTRLKQKFKTKAKEKLKEKFESAAHNMNLPAIIGTIVAIAFGLIVLCVVCCCCCPFCLLHKRRTRGTVHNPPPGGATYFYPVPAQAQLQPMMNPPVQYGPPQPAPYPQAPYPAPAYQQPPPAGYAPSPNSAPYPNAAPYPTHPMPEQPPPYAEKQMAYNPNY